MFRRSHGPLHPSPEIEPLRLVPPFGLYLVFTLQFKPTPVSFLLAADRWLIFVLSSRLSVLLPLPPLGKQLFRHPCPYQSRISINHRFPRLTPRPSSSPSSCHIPSLFSLPSVSGHQRKPRLNMASNDDNLKTDSLRLGDNNEHSVTTTAVHSQESNVQSASTPASAPELAANPLTPGHHESTPQQHIATEMSDAQPLAGGESAPPPQSPSDASTLPTLNAPAAESGASAPEAPPVEQPSQESEAKEEDQGPSLMITLLLTSGSRHPFKIDGKYLQKRSVNVENNDPFAMSVYTLKELIWREWRQGMYGRRQLSKTGPREIN